ncbi:MAG: NAD(P)-dependent oxidoreductase [Bacteroidota bacterium]
MKHTNQIIMQKVAFLGLGIMGSRMAHNLLKLEVELTVWNRSDGPVQEFSDTKARMASTVAEAVAEAEVVISMLAHPQAVEAVMCGEKGGLAAMKQGAIWMDCSTVDPAFTRASFEQARSAGLRFVGAPVAGTLPQAAAAQLVFFAGGGEAEIAQVRPLMEAMGSKVMHLGPEDQGSAFKMLVNAMLAQNMVIFSEAVLLGEKLGLDKNFLLDTLPKLKVAAPFTQFKAEMMREGTYEVQFPLELMHKDLHLASLAAYEQGQALILANATKEIFAQAKQAGLGRLDFAAVHAFLEGKA